MKVMVTGAGGFIGRHLVAALVPRHDVVAVVRRPPPEHVAGARYLTADLTRLSADSLPDEVVDVVIHQAARLDDPFGTDPTLPELAPTNVLGTIALLDWASRAAIKRFVFGSTGGVTDQAPSGQMMRETAPARPANPYGLTKHLAEQAILAYRWPFEVCSLRYYAPYGRAGSNPMVAWFLDRIGAGAPIDVGQDGGPHMNPIHIADAVALTVRAAELAGAPPRVVNVAGPEVVSRAQFVDRLASAVGQEAVLRYGPEPSPSWVADITRLRRTLGSPLIDIATGIDCEWGSERK